VFLAVSAGAAATGGAARDAGVRLAVTGPPGPLVAWCFWRFCLSAGCLGRPSRLCRPRSGRWLVWGAI